MEVVGGRGLPKLSMAKASLALKPLIIWLVPSTLLPMIETLRWLGNLIVAAYKEGRDLALEKLALRREMEVLEKEGGSRLIAGRPSVLGLVLSRVWSHW